MSYSVDFRDIVVKKIHAGMSRSDAMEFFNISRDSIYRWLKMEKKSGGISASSHKTRKPRKIDPSLLRAAFDESPDATLEEISTQFNCWPQSIHKRCVKLGITRKKNDSLLGAKRGKKA